MAEPLRELISYNCVQFSREKDTFVQHLLSDFFLSTKNPVTDDAGAIQTFIDESEHNGTRKHEEGIKKGRHIVEANLLHSDLQILL